MKPGGRCVYAGFADCGGLGGEIDRKTRDCKAIADVYRLGLRDGEAWKKCE